MRYILGFACLMALLTTPARMKGAEYVVVNKCPKYTVVNAVPKKARLTTCDCAQTGDCVCWKSECRCSACGLGGAAKQAGKSSITRTTPARAADTPPRPVQEPGSFADTPKADTSTSAPYALPAGFTSGCANGQCQNQSRGVFRRR